MWQTALSTVMIPGVTVSYEPLVCRSVAPPSPICVTAPVSETSVTAIQWQSSPIPRLSPLRRESLSGESLGTRLHRNHFSRFIGVPFLASFKSVGAFTGWKAIKSSLMSGGMGKELVEEERMKEDIEAILCFINHSQNYISCLNSYMTCNFTHCLVICF